MADASLTPISRDVNARSAIYLAVLCGYLTTAAGDPMMVIQLVVFALAAVTSLGAEHRLSRLFFPAPIKIALIFAGSFVFIYFISGDGGRSQEFFAITISRFLFWNAVVFVLSRAKTEYDLWTMSIITLSFFMISAAFVQPLHFVPLFLISMILLVYAFQRGALVRCGPTGSETSGARTSFLQVTIVLEVALVVFVLFPRSLFAPVNPGKNGALGRNGEAAPTPGGPTGTSRPAVSGFAPKLDRLPISGLGPLKLDSRPVLEMTAEAMNDPRKFDHDKPVYLRGAAYDTYAGGEWRARPFFEERTDRSDGSDDGWIDLARPASTASLVRQQIRLLADLPGMIPALAEPVRIRLDRVKMDRRGLLQPVEGTRPGTRYEIVSAYSPPGFSHIPPDSRIGNADPAFLDVPPALVRLKKLAEDITRGNVQPLARAEAIRTWLTNPSRFTYHLGGFETPPGVDLIEHFLFTERKGYCMHFASAMVLLCRSAGIPARFAGGFHTAKAIVDPDTLDRVFYFKHSDAHAWAEIAIEKAGWVQMDATPGDEGSALGDRPAVATPGTPKNSKPATPTGTGGPGEEKGRWDRLIVDFDPQTQSGALRDALGVIGGGLTAAGRFVISGPFLGTLGALAAGAFLTYLLMPARTKARFKQILSGFTDRSTVGFYQDFLWAASRRGIRKESGQTAMEYALAARTVLPADAVDFLTRKFCEVRYGGRMLAAEDEVKVQEMLLRIMDAADRKVGP